MRPGLTTIPPIPLNFTSLKECTEENRLKEKKMQLNVVTHIRFPLAILAALVAVCLSAQTPLIDQGRAALNRGDVDAAIGLLEKAVVQSPKSADAQFYLAGAYGRKAQLSGMFGGAEYASKLKDAYTKAVTLNPKYVDARFGLVQFYAGAPGIMGGSYDKALEQAKEIKAIDPVLGHRAYATIYAQQTKTDLAKKEYLDAIREQPRSPKAHSYYGQYLADVNKDFPAAAAEFELALKVDPTYMPAFYQLGRAAALGATNLARGQEALTKYVAYTPKESEPTLANAHYHLGTIYEKEGKKVEAKQSYEAALKLNPTLKAATEGLKRVS
jgi:Tfp pilus assembly protein PilF